MRGEGGASLIWVLICWQIIDQTVTPYLLGGRNRGIFPHSGFASPLAKAMSDLMFSPTISRKYICKFVTTGR